jgi:hypothetical protein
MAVGAAAPAAAERCSDARANGPRLIVAMIEAMVLRCEARDVMIAAARRRAMDGIGQLLLNIDRRSEAHRSGT